MPHEKQTVHSVIELLPAEIGTLEQAIGYRFRSREILAQALTHSSLAHEQQAKGLSCRCNERYEFLGDSILSVLTSTYIFSLFPDAPEGDLTKLRAQLVCEDALWHNACSISLGDYLLLGHGEEKNGGRERKSILADAFEALLAAMYLDSNSFGPVQRFLMPYLVRQAETLPGHSSDYKTKLQQIVQQEPGERLEYVLVAQLGPDHEKQFEMEARLNSNVIGRGHGRSKREAEQAAAKEALSLFGQGKEE